MRRKMGTMLMSVIMAIAMIAPVQAADEVLGEETVRVVEEAYANECVEEVGVSEEIDYDNEGEIANEDAAAKTVTLLPIERPNDIERNENADNGIMCVAPSRVESHYTFTVSERGWVILDSFPFSYMHLYSNATMTREVPEQVSRSHNGGHFMQFYVEPGDYYLLICRSDVTVFGYFLPNSAIMSTSLTKRNCTTYDLVINPVDDTSTSWLSSSTVGVDNVWNRYIWDGAEISLVDQFEITSNGEYTVRVGFDSSEWKNYYAMESFKVTDITDHNYIPSITQKATYAAAGIRNYTCEYCGDAFEEPIPKLTLTKPSITSISNQAGRKAKINWKKNKKATGYELQYSTDSKFKKGVKKVNIAKNSIVSKVLPKLPPKKVICVRARAYVVENGKKYYSPWSVVKKVKINK